MNYIWSKLSLLKFIENWISSIVWERDYIFSDLFAGTGIVGRYFKGKGHKVIANDMQYYSYVLNRHYIWNHKLLEFTNLTWELPHLKNIEIPTRKDYICQYLNDLPWKKGFIYKNYSLAGTKWTEFERQYFSDENAFRCDWIRTKIEKWKKGNLINEDEYYYLLACLIEATDKVANTASVYWAFLKKLKKSALKPLDLKPLELILDEHKHDIYNEDINLLISKTHHDVVYLDPPYNERQYSANYHLLETIARYDNPKIRWKTWLRDYSSQKSTYCQKQQVLDSFNHLVQNIQANYIFLSYNDEWLMSLDEIKQIMWYRWDYWVLTQDYKRFKADKTENRNHKKSKTIEYLHYVILRK